MNNAQPLTKASSAVKARHNIAGAPSVSLASLPALESMTETTNSFSDVSGSTQSFSSSSLDIELLARLQQKRRRKVNRENAKKLNPVLKKNEKGKKKMTTVTDLPRSGSDKRSLTDFMATGYHSNSNSDDIAICCTSPSSKRHKVKTKKDSVLATGETGVAQYRNGLNQIDQAIEIAAKLYGRTTVSIRDIYRTPPSRAVREEYEGHIQQLVQRSMERPSFKRVIDVNVNTTGCKFAFAHVTIAVYLRMSIMLLC